MRLPIQSINLNIAAQLKARVSRAIRPLVLQDHVGDLFSAGSSVLVKIEGHRFVLSAAHSLDRSSWRAAWLVLPRGPVRLNRGYLYSSARHDGKAENEPFDAAVLDMRDDYPMIDDGDFLSLEDLDLDGIHGWEGIHVAMGFPSELDSLEDANHLETRGITLQTKAARTATPETHLAIEFDPGHILAIGPKTIELPDPDGLSGGPVFACLDPASAAPQYKLAGIITERDRSLILATRVAIHLRLISEIHPDLYDLLVDAVAHTPHAFLNAPRT